MKNIVGLVLSCLLFISVVSSQTIIVVPDSVSTLQAAINNAGEGDIIKVKSASNDYTFPIHIAGKKHIVIESYYSGSYYTLNSVSNARAIQIDSSEDVTIRDCYIYLGNTSYGIYTNSESKYLNIRNCYIYGNSSTAYRGIYDFEGLYTNIDSTTISNVTIGIVTGADSYCSITNSNISGTSQGIHCASTMTCSIQNCVLSGGNFGAIFADGGLINSKGNSIVRPNTSAHSIYNSAGHSTIYSTGDNFVNGMDNSGPVIFLN